MIVWRLIIRVRIDGLLASPKCIYIINVGARFESAQTVWRALNDYKVAKSIKSAGKRKEADFPDALMINKAQHIANELSVEFKGAYTFDVAAQQISGAKKL